MLKHTKLAPPQLESVEAQSDVGVRRRADPPRYSLLVRRLRTHTLVQPVEVLHDIVPFTDARGMSSQNELLCVVDPVFLMEVEYILELFARAELRAR